MVDNSKQPQKRATKFAKKSAKKSLKKRILLTILSIFLLLSVAGITVAGYFIITAPNITKEQLIGTMPSTIYDKNGEVLSKLGGNDRILIDADNIPTNLEDALLSIEDRRFYDHGGVDFIRIFGSLLANIKKGGISQGGSTITQQLVKLSVFSTSTKDQTIKRKIQEMWIASQIEGQYSKKEILAFYMNKAYLGNNKYGFATASKYYFNKEIKDLSIDQVAMLAGMVQAPSYYDPYINPEATTTRRNTVLSAMVANNKITQEQYDELSKVDISKALVDHSKDKTTEELAIDSYVQYVLEELTTKTSLNPYKDGLSIYTNIDPAAQKKLVEILNTTQYIKWANNDVQAAVTVTDPNTGGIVAMVGGRNINVQLGLNRATAASRSVGSTAKPLVGYGPAVEYLDYNTSQIVSDAPITYNDAGGATLYNWNRKYMGNITMRTALAASRNTPALRTLREVGLDNAYAFLSKFNFSKVTNPLYESNAIGLVASPLEMGIAYGAFANGGTYYKPYTINKIVTQTGESATYVPEGTRVMKDSTAYIITDILKGVPGVYAKSAGISGLYHAGKSGTTNYTDEQLKIVTGGKNVGTAVPDVWYVGYSKNYVIATWVGHDVPVQLGNYLNSTESTYAQQIYKNMMTYLMKNVRNTDWSQPNSVGNVGGELYVKGSRNVIETTTVTTTSVEETSSVNDEESEPVEETSTKKIETTSTTKQTTTSRKTGN